MLKNCAKFIRIFGFFLMNKIFFEKKYNFYLVIQKLVLPLYRF